jgi:hypothetical protein
MTLQRARRRFLTSLSENPAIRPVMIMAHSPIETISRELR